MNCADCNEPIGQDEGPPDGWQLEDGRTVCHACCVVDTRKAIQQMRQILDYLTELKPSARTAAEYRLLDTVPEAGTIPAAVGVEPQGNTTKHN